MSTFGDEVLADLGRYRETEEAVLTYSKWRAAFKRVMDWDPNVAATLIRRAEGAGQVRRPPTRDPMPPA